MCCLRTYMVLPVLAIKLKDTYANTYGNIYLISVVGPISKHRSQAYLLITL